MGRCFIQGQTIAAQDNIEFALTQPFLLQGVGNDEGQAVFSDTDAEMVGVNTREARVHQTNGLSIWVNGDAGCVEGFLTVLGHINHRFGRGEHNGCVLPEHRGGEETRCALHFHTHPGLLQTWSNGGKRISASCRAVGGKRGDRFPRPVEPSAGDVHVPAGGELGSVRSVSKGPVQLDVKRLGPVHHGRGIVADVLRNPANEGRRSEVFVDVGAPVADRPGTLCSVEGRPELVVLAMENSVKIGHNVFGGDGNLR